MRPMPKVREFMTRSPRLVDGETPLEDVQRLMKELNVRHFPVEVQGDLRGIISEGNVHTALMLPHGSTYKAGDVMIPNPYVVPPDAELDLVVAAMAEEKYGSAIVQDGQGKVVGIFTTVDACRVLRQFLESFFPS